MDTEKFRQDLLNLLSKSAKGMVNHEGALCTNYILVAEFVDADNQYWTLTVKDESVPEWRHTGLLYYTLENEFVEDEEEEDDA